MRQLSSILTVCLALVVLAGSWKTVRAEDVRMVGMTATDVYFVDYATWSREGAVVTADLLVHHSSRSEMGRPGVAFARMSQQIDCEKRMGRLLDLREFNEAGEAVSYDPPDFARPWNDMQESSYARSIADLVCDPERLANEPRIPDPREHAHLMFEQVMRQGVVGGGGE